MRVAYCSKPGDSRPQSAAAAITAGITSRAFDRNRTARTSVSPGVLAEIELGRANPTVETLNKIGRAFGYEVGFRHK
jgi:transcriptional regulator with XRE-family HTH domain